MASGCCAVRGPHRLLVQGLLSLLGLGSRSSVVDLVAQTQPRLAGGSWVLGAWRLVSFPLMHWWFSCSTSQCFHLVM